jgi:hypothetical protein
MLYEYSPLPKISSTGLAENGSGAPSVLHLLPPGGLFLEVTYEEAEQATQNYYTKIYSIHVRWKNRKIPKK